MAETTSVLDKLDAAVALTEETLEEAQGTDEESGVSAVHALVLAFQTRAHELAEGVGSEVLVDELLRSQLTGLPELLVLLEEAGFGDE